MKSASEVAARATPSFEETLSVPSTDKDPNVPMSARSSRIFSHPLSRTSWTANAENESEENAITDNESEESDIDATESEESFNSSLRQRRGLSPVAAPRLSLSSRPSPQTFSSRGSELWITPKLRRTKSFEVRRLTDWNITVKVEKNDKGRRELRMCLRCCGRDARIAIQLRSLFFWLVLSMLFKTTSAFQVMGGMATGPQATRAAVQQPLRAAIGSTARLSSLLDVADNAACYDVAASAVARTTEHLQATQPAIFSGLVESCELQSTTADPTGFNEEEFEACLVDAEGDEDEISACLRTQLESSSLDELSAAIAKEGAALLQSTMDDNTLSCIVYNLLDTARRVRAERSAVPTEAAEVAMEAGAATEAAESVPQMLRRSAVRACVSIGMHKAMLVAMPAIAAATHVAVNL